MAELKTLNGYEIVDQTARDKINDLFYTMCIQGYEDHKIDYAFDYNDMVTPGIYYLDNSGPSKSTNGPYTNQSITNCYFLVLNNSNKKRTTQIILPGNYDTIFFRNTITDADNSWNQWKELRNNIRRGTSIPSSSIGLDGDLYVMY